MPQALLFQQVFEAAEGLLGVVLRSSLDSHDSVVWLAFAIGTRVVVAATALVPIVIAAAARVLFALATDGVVLGVSLVLFISPGGDHVLEVGDGARAATTEVFEGATVVETILEEVDDFLVRYMDYSGAFVEEAPHVLAKVSPCSCFTIARSMRVLERPIAPVKLLVNCSFSWSRLSVEYFSSDSSHVSGS
jgi:hypothetical protein